MDHAARDLWYHRSWWPLIALLAAITVSVTGGLRYYRRASGAPETGSVAKLAKIVGPHRLTRARLSGGFAYASCQTDSSADRLVRGLVCEGPPPASWGSVGRLRKFASDMRVGGQNDSALRDVHTAG